MRVGVVDLGTNSTRLLVAEVDGERVGEVERRNRVTRLGRGVDLTGQLSQEAVEEVCEAVGEYVGICEGAGVERVVAIATSAVRDSDNGDAFVAELRERFSLDARILDGGEDGRLTFLGATHERASGDGATLVVDIGGGSTELVVGNGDGVSHSCSLQVGTVRHTERHLGVDPPRPSALEDLAADVRGAIEAGLEGGDAGSPRNGIAVAGTPTSLAAVELSLVPYDPKAVHGHRLRLGTIQRIFSALASMPLEARSRVPGLHPRRAPTIVAGIVILVEVMRAFGLDEIEVSEHDILYGAALDAARLPSSG